MDGMNLTRFPVARAGMLIRRPVSQVFEAFIDPDITRHFWFTRSTGKLEAGKKVRWEWEMYGAASDVEVKALESNRRILIDWSGNGSTTTVEWIFSSNPDGTTMVEITHTGFSGESDSLVEQVTDSAAGFALVLAGLKAYLEHGIDLNLIADRFPDHLAKYPASTSE